MLSLLITLLMSFGWSVLSVDVRPVLYDVNVVIPVQNGNDYRSDFHTNRKLLDGQLPLMLFLTLI